ncbi:tetratricopeptide repeat protein [Salinimicrobium sediminilitoris]|uniref:tetratricopeptide repeat protein n=1 Tax=Salinimicrobium sediminilitoris TaxID=2876715 RepID=UPI001E373773|nr:tetratricopeptide repeat protein [Salinimicrobium sediminilitoris]MCC8360576.1 tetratricopeptide repeat protein [Salinimicrobium sediminilitoris]
MKHCKICLFVVLVFSSVLGFSQQSAIQTNELADYNRALELYNNQQYLAAQTLFDEVQDEVDDERIKANAAYYIANAAIRLNQPGADALMEDFVERYPTSTKTNAAYLDVADYYFETGKYSLARKWYDTVDQRNLSKAEKERFNFNNGYAYFKANQPEEAKEYLSKVKDSKKYGSQAKYYLGFMAYEGDDYEQANALFEEVEGTERYEEDLSYFQADMNFKQGNFEKAIQLGLEQLPRADRRDRSELNKIIGESYFNLGQYEKAIPYLKEYQGERGKWNNTDYYQLGYAYFQQGNYEAAISEFNKIIDGKNAVAQNAYYHLAQSYLKDDKKQQALNAFKNASEMDFNPEIKADAALNYAKLSYEIGNSYASTPQVLMNYLEAYPNSPAKEEINELLINSFITSKNYEEAMRLLKGNRNFQNNVVYQQVAFYRGLELFEEGKYREAKEYFDLALTERRDPRFTALATFWKAETDFNLRNFDEALVGYREFAGMSGAKGASEKENLDYNIGYAYFKQRDYARSIEFFKRFANDAAKDRGRRNDAFVRLGDSHFVNSSYWPAMDAYNAAIALNGSENDYAAFQKAISYGFVQRNETKIQELTEFLRKYPRSSYRDDAAYELGNTYVAMNNTSQGMEAYNRLIRDVPGSAFVPQALLKQGLIYYNNDQSNQALDKLKKVVADFPNSAEAIQAVSTARLIYVDLGRTDEYANWVKDLDFVEVTDVDLDNTTFESAEKQYQNNNTSAAITALDKYLVKFPNGIHSVQAHFYLGQLYFREGNREKSIPHYKYVIGRSASEYLEQSLARLSEVYLENSNYSEAIPLLKRLESQASFAQNTIFAQSNLMKSYLETGKYDEAVSYAEKVLANPNAETSAKNDAQVIIARAAMRTGNEERAKRAYAEVQKSATGELAAEALYYDAYFKNKAGNFQASNDAVQRLAKDYSGYKLFGAKGLVLMAKNFYALGDAYQATYILDNVIKNFTQFPEVVNEAKQELARIKAQEARTNASVETNN